MTTGTYTYGGGAEQDFRLYKSWSGTNDTAKKRAENAYTCVIQRMSRGKTNRYHPDGSLFDSIFLIRGLYSVPPAGDSNQELACLAKLTSAIRGHDFNGAVFAAEAKQSLDTITNSTTAVTQMLRHLLRGNLSAAIRALGGVPGQINRSQVGKMVRAGDISGAVLALRYGWQPLLQDCFEAAKAFEALTKQPRTVTYRARSRVQFNTQDSASVPSTGDFLARQVRDISYKVVLRETPLSARSLGLLDPASVLWEKLPWSFVADWFIPIGSYLDTASFLGTLSMTSVRTEFRAGYASCTTPPPPLSAGWVNVGGHWKTVTINLERTVGGNPGVPFPTLKGLDRIFGLTHIQNAAALVHNRAASIRGPR